MNFKDQTLMLVESKEIIEESISNNSASNRLKSLIDKAESKGSNKDASKVLETLRKGYNDFLRIENNYKNSKNSFERKQLKNEYDKLKQDYSYQLKKIHLPKGAAAALLGAALAITGAGLAKENKPEAKPAITKTYKSEKELNWEKRKAELEAKNKEFRNAEKKSEESFNRNNVIGFAKKLYKDGVISAANRKSLDSFDFYDFKNALMAAYSVDGSMTEENGKKFAKEYLKLLESKAPLNHKIVIDLARKYIEGPKLNFYDNSMKKSKKYFDY